MSKTAEVEKFLREQMGEPAWHALKEDKRAELVEIYSDSDNMETLLYRLQPERYVMEYQPELGGYEDKYRGMTKQEAGDLTGGDTTAEKVISTVGTAGAGIVEGTGALLRTATEVAGLEAVKGLEEYGRNLRVDLTPAYGSGTERFVYGAVSSGVRNLYTLAGSAAAATALGLNPVTAVPAMSMAANSILSGSQAASESLDEAPGERLKALSRGGAYAVAEYLGEAIPTKYLTQTVTKGNLGPGQILNYLKKETLGEMGTEVGQLGADVATGVGDTSSPYSRVLKAGAASLISGPVIAGGARVVQPLMTAAQTKFDAKTIAEEETRLRKAEEEGKVTTVDEPAGLKPVTKPFVVDENNNPVDEQTLESSAKLPKGYKVVMPVEAPSATRNLPGEEATPKRFKAGEEIWFKLPVVKTPGGRKSAALGGFNGIPGLVTGQVVQQFDDGKVKVSIPDEESETGFTEEILNPDQIATKEEVGIRGTQAMPGIDSPNLFSLITVSKDLMTDISGWLKAAIGTGKTPKAFGDVVIDLADGTAKRMRLDYALQNFPALAQKTLSHELGHIISLIAESTNIPGMENTRPKEGSLLGKMVGEYFNLKETILKKPFELNNKEQTAEILEQQRKFVDPIYQNMEKEGRMKMTTEEKYRVQDNWDRLATKYAGELLSKEDFAEMRTRSKEIARLMQKPKEWRSIYENMKKTALRDQGVLSVPEIEQEMVEVSMKMRGIDNSPEARRLFKNKPNEVLADFISAKMLNMVYQDPETGRFERMTDYYAPQASGLYDEYISRSPAAQKLFEQLRSVRTDADSVVKKIQEEQRKTDQKKLERINLQSPEGAFMMGTLKDVANRFGQAFVDRNLPALSAIKQNRGWDVVDAVQDNLEQLAGITAVNTPFLAKATRIFDDSIQLLREKAPDVAAEAEDLFGIFMSLKRVASGGRKGEVIYKLKSDGGYARYLKKKFDLFTGEYGGQEAAQKILDEHSIFSRQDVHEPLDNALQEFSQLWKTEILNPIRDAGLISEEAYNALSSNIYYATYAVEMDMMENPTFRGLTASIKPQKGTLLTGGNPAGATLEKGMNLKWSAYLNKAKQSVIDNLPSEYVQEVKPKNNLFPEPADKQNYSLLRLYRDGKEYGYHVPTVFVAGLEFQQGKQGILHNQYLRWMGARSEYFRKLYTTWNPRFFFKNVLRDAGRLLVRSIDPNSQYGLGTGVLWEYWKVLRDEFAAYRGDEAARERLRTEEEELFKEAMIMSDYDFQARDARDVSSYANLRRMMLQDIRESEARSAELDKGYEAGKTLAALTANSKLNSIMNLPRRYGASMEGLSRAAERAPKRAAYRYYKKHAGKMSRARRNTLVRKAGSPYFLNHGTAHPLTSNVLMFFNPSVQAMYEDINLARRNPMVGVKAALASMTTLGMNIGLMAAIASIGGLGEEMKRAMDGIPMAHKVRGINIPFGIDAAGETLYIHLPVDENTSFFARLAYRAAISSWRDVPSDAIMVGMEGLSTIQPSFNPLIGTFLDMGLIAQGEPRPLYSTPGQIPRRDLQAAGWRKWRHFIRNTYNSMSPTSVLWRWSRPETSEQALRCKTGKAKSLFGPDKVTEVMSKALDLPTEMLVGGLIKKSSYGVQEKADIITADVNQVKNMASLMTDELVAAAVNEDRELVRSLTNEIADLGKDGPAHRKVVQDAFKRMNLKLKQAILGSASDLKMVEFMRRSKAEQLALLNAGWLHHISSLEGNQ